MKPIIDTSRCCDVGTYEHQIPMPINGRMRGIDYCIADIVAALNAANIPTVASCCGHGKRSATVSLQDGREISVGNVMGHLNENDDGRN